MYASSNAERFIVHRDATLPQLAGPSATQMNRLEAFVQAGESGACYRQLQKGDVWGWKYTGGLNGSVVWAGIDSGGTLQCLWESTDTMWRFGYPIIMWDAVNMPVLPGGIWRRMVMPSETILEAIQADIDGASMPLWLEDEDGEFATPTELHKQLFNILLASDRYVYGWFSTYGEYINLGYLDKTIKEYLTHQWLRAASQILYDHPFPTMIPLVMDKFAVDGTTGIVSLV